MRREWEFLVINNKVKVRIVLGWLSDFFYYSLNRYISLYNLGSVVVYVVLIFGFVFILFFLWV